MNEPSNKPTNPFSNEPANIPPQPATPTPPEAEQPPIVPQRPKSRKTLLVILSIIVVLLIAGGVVAYLYFTRTSTEPQNDLQPQQSVLTAETISTTLRPLMQGQLHENSDEASFYSAPGYQPDGYAFSTFADTASGFHVTGTQTQASQNLSASETYLAEKGLVKTVLEEGDEQAMYAARYESASIICIIQDGKPFMEADGYSVTLGCADKEAYSTKAQSLVPFFDAYKQSNPDAEDLLLADLTIEASETAGYQKAIVGIGGAKWGSVGGFAGLFYQAPSADWKFFIGTQSVLMCSQFNTDELKKAYLGETCYEEDSDKQTTVTL